MKEDKTSSAIKMLMQMANIIDERGFKEPNRVGIGISSQDLFMGFRAWTIKLRQTINIICDLQAQVFSLKERIMLQNAEIDSCPDLDRLTDDGAKKVKDFYSKILNKEDEALDKEMEAENDGRLDKYIVLVMNTEVDDRVPEIVGVYYDEEKAREVAQKLIKNAFEIRKVDVDSDNAPLASCLEDCQAYFYDEEGTASRYYVTMQKVED